MLQEMNFPVKKAAKRVPELRRRGAARTLHPRMYSTPTEDERMRAQPSFIPALAAVLLAACAPEQRPLATDDPTDAEELGAANRPVGDRLGGDNRVVTDRGLPIDRDDPADAAETLADAEQQIDEAASVIAEMKADPEIAALLDQAHGIFVVPDYAQAGLVVGGEGGEGVVSLKSGNAAASEWSAPVFFNIGGVTAGAAAGVEAGSVVLLMMTEEAALPFRNDDTDFSLVSSANLTIVDFSERAEGDVGASDIVVWSSAEGAFAGATIGLRGISRDDDEIAAFYGPGANAREILAGARDNPRADRFQSALTG
jgi:lipid-binding SYLF domain-containing protein